MQTLFDLLGRRPAAIYLEPPQHANANDVLVEEIDDPAHEAPISAENARTKLRHPHVSVASVRPMPVHEDQPLQEPELRDGVVGRVHSL